MEIFAISSFSCHQIHGDGCQTPLESSYAFCPQCGRATLSLRAASSAPLISLRGAPASAFLLLKLRGQRSLVFSARFESREPLRIKGRDGLLESISGQIPRPASGEEASFSLSLAWIGAQAPPIEPEQIPVFLTSHDAEPRDGFDIEPGNRARVWEPLYLLVCSPRPARLEIETGVLILGGRSRQRTLTLHNSGEMPLALRPLLLPAGFEIEAAGRGPGEWTLAPGARKSWTIRALSGAKTGESRVTLTDTSGKSWGEIVLLVPAVSGLTTRTRYVLGVDFGTSGTSIWKRDGRDDRLPAQPLSDPNVFGVTSQNDPHRFPSVLYVSFQNGHERGFYIGYEAVRRHKEDAEKGLWVRELKTLLRADDEPFVAEFGPNYRVDLLLRRYLEQLRLQIINPQLEGGDAASVAWNFSLPVLDSHRGGSKKLFDLQKGRLESAIRAAGYIGSGDALEFFSEPFCAAIYLLLEHGKYRYPRFDPPQDGDWACIFDSGGGTTDVVLGQLHLEEGQMRFEEVSTLGGYLSAPDQGGEPDVATFGGEALTRTTAIYLSVWQNERGAAYDFLRAEVEALRQGGQLKGLESEAVYQGLKEVATLALSDERVWRESEIPRRGKAPLENGWVRFADLWDKTEAYKRQIASLGTPGARAALEFPALAPGEAPQQVSIARQEFDQVVVNRRLGAIGAEMRSRVFSSQESVPAPVEVKWVFGVGGNCRVRRVQDWLQEFFPGRVQDLTRIEGGAIDESDRMLAVAGGAVWAGKASRDNTLPYALRIEDERGAEVFAAAAQMPLGAVRPSERIYELPFGHTLRFGLLISGKISGEGGEVPFAGVAGCFSVSNQDAQSAGDEDDVPRRAITVGVGLEGRRLVVWSNESGAAQEVFAYNL